MRFGVVIEPSGRRGLELAVEAAEDNGFDSLLVPAGEDGWLDPLTVAEFVGAITSNVRILVEVYPGLDHPLLLAESLASLDAAIKGRLEAIALTPTARQCQERGLDPDKTSTSLSEALEVVRSAWRCRPFRHVGQHWTIPALLESNGPDLPEYVQMTTLPNQIALPIWKPSGDVISRPIGPGDSVTGAILHVGRSSYETVEAVDRASTDGVDLGFCSFHDVESADAIRWFARAVAPRFRAAAIPRSILEQLDGEID